MPTNSLEREIFFKDSIKIENFYISSDYNYEIGTNIFQDTGDNVGVEVIKNFCSVYLYDDRNSGKAYNVNELYKAKNDSGSRKSFLIHF